MARSLSLIVTFLVVNSWALAPTWASDAVFEDEIVVTATGEETEVAEVPVPVSVINRQQIDDAQTETVADLLRRVPGMVVMRSGGESGVASLFTRGTESDHTLVLMDGVRLNSPYFAGFDAGLLSTAGLDRIEVVRGPFSALYGPDAVGGVVNLITGGFAPGLSGGLFVEGGDDSWRRMQGSLTYAGDSFHLFASGFSREAEGELGNSDFDATQLLVNAGWVWGNGHRVGVLVQDLDTETGIPYVTPGTLTPNRRQWSAQRLAAVPLTFSISPDWTLQVTASSVWRDFSFRDPDDPLSYTEGDTEADSSQVRLASRHTLGRHEVTVGGEWRQDEVTDVTAFGVNLDGNTSQVGSAFIQDVWSPNQRLRLIAGLRWDESDEWGNEVSPRLNLGWRLGDRLELRAGYGEAFRQPALGELYYPFMGNPDLEAERSRSYEVGLAHRGESGRSSWQITAFATDLDNMIEYHYASYTFENVREARIRGAELGVVLPLTRTLSSTVQLTYLDTENDDGLPLWRRPELSGSLTIAGSLGGNLRGDLSVIWVGDRDDIDPITFARTQAPSFTTAHLGLAYRILSSTELTLRVVNLADRQYQEVLGYPAPGRRVIGGFRLTL